MDPPLHMRGLKKKKIVHIKRKKQINFCLKPKKGITFEIEMSTLEYTSIPPYYLQFDQLMSFLFLMI